MIIVDGNYFARRFFHMAQGENDNKNMNSMDYFRHTFLLNLNSIKYKYQKDYGKIVLAIDYKSWRKDFYPEYKDNRKDKEEDPLSLEFIKIFDELYTLLQEYTKIKVIKVYKAEADDVLFELSKIEPEKKGEKHLVYSGDKDISQCISDICDFYDFNTKVILKMDPKRKAMNLRKHIIMGDKGDNIPNIAWNAEPSQHFRKWFRRKYNFDITTEIMYKKILENDSIFKDFEKENNLKAFKQTQMGDKSADKYLDDRNLNLLLESNPIIKRNFTINTVLIDMKQIPQPIKEAILETYNNYEEKDVDIKKMNEYCDKYNLHYMKERLKYLIY